MAAINELIDQIENVELRNRILTEVNKLSKQRKFGLVYEEHIPEATMLYDVPIRKGTKVALRSGKIKDCYRVLSIKGNDVLCEKMDDSHARETFPKNDLVAVAHFGEPIYPYLQYKDSICNAPDSDLWHTLIEADNYHALQLLVYLYGGKVDCIYIDPPYNTGARDWKYNNDYVDTNDSYRHSKWLSMLEKRLKLAKKLLNPNDSVLIVTIDEKEYAHLSCLLEQLFTNANIQMVSSAINGKGVAREAEFSRVNEYIFIVRFGNCGVEELSLPDEWLGNVKTSTTKQVRWGSLMRSGTNSERSHSPGCFYPIFITEDKKHFCGAGEPLPLGQSRDSIKVPDGQVAIFPIHANGEEGVWQYSRKRFLEIQSKGYARISTHTKKAATIRYISEGWQNRVENGEIAIIGKAEDGSLIFNDDKYIQKYIPSNQWWITAHDATEFGSKLLQKIIGKRFTFPKSLYAEEDTIRFFVANKPNALILDFFAGSGTTLHAVNLLNAEDGGHRRCIMVTNNEIGDAKEKELIPLGIQQGDEEWEKWGIARYVNWPRTKCSILGVDIEGNPIDGNYVTNQTEIKLSDRRFNQITFLAEELSLKQKKALVSLINKQKSIKLPSLTEDIDFLVGDNEDSYNASILFKESAIDDWKDALEGHDEITDFFIVTQKDALFRQIKREVIELMGKIETSVPMPMPMKDGFKANAIYFKLGFLDKTAVSIGRQLKELIPLLWMKAGAINKCPQINGNEDMVILPKNKFALLVNECAFSQFETELRKHPEIEVVYIITNSEAGYREMITNLKVKQTYQLYRDYLDNFRINYTK